WSTRGERRRRHEHAHATRSAAGGDGVDHQVDDQPEEDDRGEAGVDRRNEDPPPEKKRRGVLVARGEVRRLATLVREERDEAQRAEGKALDVDAGDRWETKGDDRRDDEESGRDPLEMLHRLFEQPS